VLPLMRLSREDLIAMILEVLPPNEALGMMLNSPESIVRANVFNRAMRYDWIEIRADSRGQRLQRRSLV